MSESRSRPLVLFYVIVYIYIKKYLYFIKNVYNWNSWNLWYFSSCDVVMWFNCVYIFAIEKDNEIIINGIW